MCFSVQIDKNVKLLSQKFRSGVAVQEFHHIQKIINENPQLGFKIPTDDGRVFPNYFSPVIKSDQGQRVIYPMRYRIRPSNSLEEIPNKFNVFNARLDSLETRKTWKDLFGKNHGLVPFKKFYEWVEDKNSKKKLISFFPENNEMMWSPCLYDYWQSPDRKISFFSFAIITTDPPEEILSLGHDRCPIFLKEENIDLWLNSKNKNECLKILGDSFKTKFGYEWQM
jgi:putative SOS response-associated peptidase YedK